VVRGKHHFQTTKNPAGERFDRMRSGMVPKSVLKIGVSAWRAKLNSHGFSSAGLNHLVIHKS
jgi:hypothetical protein